MHGTCVKIILSHYFMIAGFDREVDVTCALLGCHAAYGDYSFPTFRYNLSTPSSMVKKSKSYWPLKVVPKRRWGIIAIRYIICHKNAEPCCSVVLFSYRLHEADRTTYFAFLKFSNCEILHSLSGTKEGSDLHGCDTVLYYYKGMSK